jgi:hypothetical protein
MGCGGAIGCCKSDSVVRADCDSCLMGTRDSKVWTGLPLESEDCEWCK